MSPNRAGVARVHRLYVGAGRRSNLEVSPDAAQTDAKRTPDDATQQYRNISVVTSCAISPDQLSIYRGAGQPCLRHTVAIRPTH